MSTARQPKREQPQAAREARRARRRATLARLAWAAGLVLALGFVIWRQTVGHDRMAELEALRKEISEAEAEKVDLTTEILRLQRRERIVGYARERLGMHVARDDEIVLLPVPAPAARDDSAAGDDS